MPVVNDYTALLSGDSWNISANVPGARGIVVTYSLTTSVLAAYTDTTYYDAIWSAQAAATHRAFTDAEAAIVRQSFQAWDNVSGIRLVEVASGLGDINISVLDLDSDPAAFGTNVAGLGYYPGYSDDFITAIGGEIFIDNEYAADPYVLLHEIGHAIGLKHPFEGTTTLASDMDNATNTVMSYTGRVSNQTLGPLDIQAIQSLYGTQAADGAQAASVVWSAASTTLTQTGFATADTLVGVSTSDIMNGMAGDDTLSGMLGDDVIDGGEGADALYGGGGNDRLIGGADNDRLFGEAGNDVFVGGAGNDQFEGGDYSYGGGIEVSGIDIADYTSSAQAVTVDLATVRYDNAGIAYNAIGADIGLDFFGYNLSIDSAFGGAAADSITGSSVNNILQGRGGADTLSGLAGNDALVGDGPLLLDDAALSVRRLYLATLGRGPDDGGWVYWADQAQSASIASIAVGFVNSAEFASKYGPSLTNDQFVTLLYQNVFHRAPDAGGLSHWTTFLSQGHSRAEVVVGLSESAEMRILSDPEKHVAQVYRLYGATLAREPDRGGLQGWANAMDNGMALETIAGGFVGSAEFQARYGNLTNTQFVELLYQNVLARAADTAGLNDWVGRLDGGATRTSVVLGFSESAEYVAGKQAPLVAYMRADTTTIDRMDGGAGDDKASGGAGADVFSVSHNALGTDHIYDWEAWDQLQLLGFGYASQAAAKSHMAQIGDNVVFADQGETITLHGTTLADVSVLLI